MDAINTQMYSNSGLDIETITPDELVGSLNDIEKKFAPKLLYLSGDKSLMKYPRVSIIGTRNPSEKGKEYTHLITNFLVMNKVVIVSGLAAGIDTVAHKTAIAKRGRTVAVLGTPLNKYYPQENQVLQDEIIKNHLVVSQFPDGSPIQRKNFPMRNRTMALLSHASIIVEAREGSGTLHQGWEALRLGRPLYIIQETIKDEWASKLVEYGAEILPISKIKVIMESLPATVPTVTKGAPF